VWASRFGKAAVLVGLGVALTTGGAVAATSLPINSVGSAQIQDEGVWGGDIHRNTIDESRLGWAFRGKVDGIGKTAEEAKAAAAQAQADATKALEQGGGEDGVGYGCDGKPVTDPANAPKCEGTPGKDGEAGAAGADGTNGADGKDGVSGYEVVAKEVQVPAVPGDASLPPKVVTVSAACPAGKVALGGGYKLDNSKGISVFHNMAAGLTKSADGSWSSTGWDVKVSTWGNPKTNLTAFVTCATVQG
jgi:hypothetical protein